MNTGLYFVDRGSEPSPAQSWMAFMLLHHCCVCIFLIMEVIKGAGFEKHCKPSASITETNYQTQLTDPGERRKRFRELPSLTTEFSSSVWDDALRVLVRDSPFLVDAIKDARSVTEYELGQRFRELMETASNTPRFVKGVQRFSKQIPELLDRVFEKLVTVVDEQRAFTNEDL